MLQTVEYSRLRKIARGLIRDERECTLTATGLVHELLLRDSQRRDRMDVGSNPQWLPARQLPYAARIMKQILIDRARRRRTRKQSEDQTSVSNTSQHQSASQFVVDLDDAINELGTVMPENAELARLHLYAELSIEAAADKLEISRATAYRKWAFCKSWLASRLKIS